MFEGRNIFKRVLDVIEKSINGKWNWLQSNNCKYITVRIDMRSGDFLLMDRDNKEIDIETLEHQEKF